MEGKFEFSWNGDEVYFSNQTPIFYTPKAVSFSAAAAFLKVRSDTSPNISPLLLKLIVQFLQ
jgi:hypothetical protein